jgi:hypothetical protein
MKLYVVGGCQAVPLASCLSAMSPGLDLVRIPTTVDVSEVASADDVVFRYRNPQVAWTLRAAGPNEMLYPRIWFNAFHPDLVYVAGPAGPVPPPLGDYHSSLVLYGWQRGLDAAQTAKLFSQDVFERLNFFRYWHPAKRALLEEGERIGFSLDASFARWERHGAFMHTANHPALLVSADIARELARRAELPIVLDAPESYVGDTLIEIAVWPVYPEIATRLGVSGSYAFKTAGSIFELDEFIARSFEAYAQMPASALACPRLETPAYRDLEAVVGKGRHNGAAARAAAAEPRSREGSPYADLPGFQFWRRAVETVPAPDIDPVGTPRFTLDRSVRIATAGSCFAQNVSRALERSAFNYLVTEAAPAGCTRDAARLAGYGVFSTRSGNVYTARQLLQLLERALGTFEPAEPAWVRPDGRFADPFRPLIEPQGFATVDELLASRERHFAAVRNMFEQLEVLIYTLGLTEAWTASEDGAVFPLAPGVVAGRRDPAKHAFRNFTAGEVTADLDAFLVLLARVNPGARVVLTVSPVPLIATYEPRHVVVSTTFSKAALRVAADEIERAHANVSYFPAYELIAGTFNGGRYFERDLRTVTAEGVDHVMRLFFAHYAPHEQPVDDTSGVLLGENRDNVDFVCDEEAIASALAASTRGSVRGAAFEHEYAARLAAERQDDRVFPAEPWIAPATMEKLAPAAMKATLDATLPSTITASAVVTLPCAVTNAGDAALSTSPPHPVYACYRWYGERGEAVEAGSSIHTPLPGVLSPGAVARLSMRVAAPALPGRYRLRVTLLQSEVAWFEDVDPASGISATVDVTAHETAQRLDSVS